MTNETIADWARALTDDVLAHHLQGIAISTQQRSALIAEAAGRFVTREAQAVKARHMMRPAK